MITRDVLQGGYEGITTPLISHPTAPTNESQTLGPCLVTTPHHTYKHVCTQKNPGAVVCVSPQQYVLLQFSSLPLPHVVISLISVPVAPQSNDEPFHHISIAAFSHVVTATGLQGGRQAPFWTSDSNLYVFTEGGGFRDRSTLIISSIACCAPTHCNKSLNSILLLYTPPSLFTAPNTEAGMKVIGGAHLLTR